MTSLTKQKLLFCVEIFIVSLTYSIYPRSCINNNNNPPYKFRRPPGRPIIAAMDSITTSFSTYIDQFLQPLVQNLQSYIRDGTHLDPYSREPSYSWVSLDVNSFYTSKPHQFGLSALNHFMSADPFPTLDKSLSSSMS